MEELLQIKQGSKHVLYKFFKGLKKGETNNYTDILSAILQVISFNTPNTILDFLVKVGKKIPLFDKFSETLAGSKKCSIKNQNLFIQLSLILNCSSY